MGANRHGNRSAKRSGALALSEAFPDRMRSAMAPLLEDYLREFEFDLKNRTLGETNADGDPMPNPAHRTAMDMYPRIMRVVGASDEVVAALLMRLNMPNEPALLAAAELYHAVQGQDVREVYVQCRKLVDWCEGPNGPPEVRAMIAAQAVHTNGNGEPR